MQATWLGYPAHRPDTIDYRLTDPYLDPPGQGGDEFYSERLDPPAAFVLVLPPGDPDRCGK